MELWLGDVELTLNAEELEERAETAAIVQRDYRLWGHENRLGLWRGAIRRRTIESGHRDIMDLPLRCVAHPHPECRFRYVHLVVDLTCAEDGAPQSAVVEDLSPRYVEGPEPVKIITKRAGELGFTCETLNLGPNISAEMSQEYQVYFPVIRSSGVGFGTAVWDFEAVLDAPLHVDRDLWLCVSVPTALSALYVQFRFEVRLQCPGLTSWLPLIGRRTVSVTATDLVT